MISSNGDLIAAASLMIAAVAILYRRRRNANKTVEEIPSIDRSELPFRF